MVCININSSWFLIIIIIKLYTNPTIKDHNLSHTESRYCNRAVNYPNKTCSHIESYIITIDSRYSSVADMHELSHHYNVLQDHQHATSHL